jgi:hypothetical protein
MNLKLNSYSPILNQSAKSMRRKAGERIRVSMNKYKDRDDIVREKYLANSDR